MIALACELHDMVVYHINPEVSSMNSARFADGRLFASDLTGFRSANRENIGATGRGLLAPAGGQQC